MRRWLLHLLVLFALVGAACGGDDDADAEGGQDAAEESAGGSESDEGDNSGGSDTDTQRGGTVRLGTSGVLGPNESLDPHNWAVDADIIRVTAMFETLLILDADMVPQPLLATSMSPNEDATVWTVVLQPDATWHDGSPVTSADVLYTFTRIQENFLRGIVDIALVDLENTVIVDDKTIEIALLQPQSNFNLFVTTAATSIIQEGTEDFTAPIGSGPFQFESFNPGDRSVMSRYDGYWGDVALVDQYEVLSIGDPSALANALLSGEIDIAYNLPVASVAQVEDAGFTIERSEPASAAAFYMRADTPPFDNPAVRKALRLAIDRESCVEVGLLGSGRVANDMLGPMALRGADASPLEQRVYDPDEARRILDEAGITDLSVELVTANVGQGGLECALAFSQHAAEAGIEIVVTEVPIEDIYNTETGYLENPFGVTQWDGLPFEIHVRLGQMTTSFYNEAAEFSIDDMILAAEAELDPKARLAAYEEIERYLWENGGYIVWGDQINATALAPNVVETRDDIFGPDATESHYGWGIQYLAVSGDG